MKDIRKRLFGGTVSVLVLVIIPFVNVSAQVAPAAPPPGGTFDQRLVQRKAEQNIQLDRKAQDRLTSKCVGAQNAVRSIQQKAGSTLDSREKAYQRIDGILWVTIGELKLAEQDTFNLERQRAQLAADAKTFQTTVDYYLQTLDDIAVINCQADPAGFKALLETARAYHQQIRVQSANIKTYVVDTIKPTIAKHTQDLQTRPATEEE